jgi:hypothetical protein
MVALMTGLHQIGRASDLPDMGLFSRSFRRSELGLRVSLGPSAQV